LYYGWVLNEETLRQRYDLVEVDGEGVLVDSQSGAVYRLNSTGYKIWAAMFAGQSVVAIVDSLVNDFGLHQEQAENDVIGVLDRLPEVPRCLPPSQYRWGATPRGYGFFEKERLLCDVNLRGDSLRLGDAVTPTDAQARAYLKSVVPRLLALRGIDVLHASAVDLKGSLLVFSGRSGAGKTTSAKAFARGGALLVSEDLLVLADQRNAPEAIVDGENTLRTWVAEQAARLVSLPDQPIDCAGLDRCATGSRSPIGRILLLDAERRVGDQIQVEELPRPEALVALMESIYFASNDTSSWRSSLLRLRALVSGASTARATMPRLAGLQTAATAFSHSDITAS
jgi:hypothetical protein